MPISQLGAINTTALIVPDVRVQIVPPQVALLNGVPSNILGVVGSAPWGKKDAPVVCGSMVDYAARFGEVQPVMHDLGTAVAAAVLQGANSFMCVRITDGTDLAASKEIDDGSGTAHAFLATAKYTGSRGNEIFVTIGEGSNSNDTTLTYKVSVALSGAPTEVFDNIGGATGAEIYTAMVNAINLGQGPLRGPSELIVASAPLTNASTDAPTLPHTSEALEGGTDGNIADADTATKKAKMIGVDTGTRTGMYALRGTGAQVVNLADFTDSSTYTTQASFGLGLGAYMITAGPPGQSISAAISAKKAVGLDSYAVKLMHGDWTYFSDPVSGVLRLISPASFVAGRIAGSSPEQSSLNKPLFGIVGTQTTAANLRYSEADLSQLAQAGIDVVTNPVPGGDYFACRIGHNTSSDPTTRGDNYTRVTNYIALTLNAGMGKFVGRLQSADERRRAKSVIESFLAAMESQGQIGNADGTTPFLVTLDSSNNTPTRVALGYMQCDVKVQYLSVIEHFLINLEGGQSVSIERVSTAPAA